MLPIRGIRSPSLLIVQLRLLSTLDHKTGILPSSLGGDIAQALGLRPQESLEDMKRQLEPLHRAQLRARRRALALSWGGFAGLSVQFVSFIYLTWEVSGVVSYLN